MKNKKTVIFIFFLALLLRLIPVLLSYDLKIGLDDMFQYDMLARSLADGNGYRWYAQDDLDLIQQYFPMEIVEGEYDPQGVLTSFRPPGYPAFLSLIYRFSGLEHRFFIARIIQAIIGAIFPVLTFFLGRQLFPKKEQIAKIAGLIIACYPMLIIFPMALATENTFMPLALASILMIIKAAESHRNRDYLFAGVLFALTILTRSVYLAVLPFVLVWLLWIIKNKKGTWIFFAIILLLTVPWGIRNTLLHDRFYFIESAMGYDMYMGYHPESSGTFQYGISLDLMPYLDDAVRDELGMEKTIEFIKEDPGRVPYLMIRKLGFFFGLERRAISYFYSNNFLGHIPNLLLMGVFSIFILPFMIVSSLGVFGFSFSKWTKKKGLLFMVVIAYIIPHVLILAEDRFHLTLLPIFSLWAAFAWVNRGHIRSEILNPSNQWKLALSLSLLMLLFLNWGYEIWLDGDRIKLLFGPDGNYAGFSY